MKAIMEKNHFSSLQRSMVRKPALDRKIASMIESVKEIALLLDSIGGKKK
jgi:hypothetical protein